MRVSRNLRLPLLVDKLIETMFEPPRELTKFGDLRTFRYAWPPEGNNIAYSRDRINQNVVLLTRDRDRKD